MYGAKFCDKRKFYQDFLTFNNKIKNEIAYSMNTIPNVLSENKRSGTFYTLLNKYLVSKSEFVINEKYLNDDEKTFTKNYFDVIGKSDRDSQLEFISSISTQIEDKVNASIADEKKYKGLYLKLGFLIGLVALIALL